MSQGESRPDKHDVAQALLLRGSVYVYLDPRHDAVRVPPWLTKQPQLVLQFGLQLPVPIRDMQVDEEGVFGTLSFNRQPFACQVPWAAVFALVGDDGMGMVWEEDLPEEVADEVTAGFRKRDAKKRPALRSIEGGKAEQPDAGQPKPESRLPDHSDAPPRRSMGGAASAAATTWDPPDDPPPEAPRRPMLKSVPPPKPDLEEREAAAESHHASGPETAEASAGGDASAEGTEEAAGPSGEGAATRAAPLRGLAKPNASGNGSSEQGHPDETSSDRSASADRESTSAGDDDELPPEPGRKSAPHLRLIK